MASSPQEIRKHIGTYWLVGVALCVFTCITLALGLWPPFDFGLPGVSPKDIVVGLLVATIKTSLVMLIFMHLSNERGLIYKVLLFTLAFAVGLMGLILFAKADPIHEHTDVTSPVSHEDEMSELTGGAASPTPH